MAELAATQAVSDRPASPLAQDLATIGVLVRRDLTRFVREKSRIVGALVQPLIFWLVLGSGMSSTFRLPGGQSDVDYMEYFFPGVIVMVVLFTAIFTTMSVIEDRSSGFLQAVLVAPGSRAAVVLGKCLGASSIAMIQGAAFLLLSPLAGFDLMEIAWPEVLAGLGLTCLALCTLGFGVAWWLDSTAGYHVVMSLVLLPLWILSGAMFPASEGVMAWVQRLNPMTYAVSLVRRGIYGEALPDGMVLITQSALFEVGVLALFLLASFAWAVRLCYRNR